MTSILTKNQKKKFTGFYEDNGTRHRVTATVRHDDECGNGHNTFAITADVAEEVTKYGEPFWRNVAFGCSHDDIARAIPELAPYIKWHLCSSDQPLHYIANTVYHAGDRDHNGLRKGEERQVINGKTGLPVWEARKDSDHTFHNVAAETCPAETATIRYFPAMKIGEGKERNLDAARSCAIWPDATDEELTAPGLEDRLKARHAQLMTDFRAAVESLGFIY